LAASGAYGYEVSKPELADDTNLVTRNLDLSVTQLIWDFGNVNSQVKGKRLEVAALMAQLEDARQTVMRDSIIAYIDILRFTEIVDILVKSVAVIVKQGKLEQKKLKLGAGTTTDVLKNQSKLLDEEDSRIIQLKLLRTAQNTYRRRFKSFPPPLKNMVKPSLPIELIPATVEEAIEIAFRENALLISGRMGHIAARQNIKTSLAQGFFPKIEGVFDTKFKKDAAGTIGDKRETVSKIQFSYSFNLGGTAINTLRQTEETSKSITAAYFELRSQTEQAVREAWDKLRTAQERFQILMDGLAIHTKSLELVQLDRKKGKSSALEVLAAISQLTKAQGSLAFEEAEVITAAFDLLYAMGRLKLETIGGSPIN
jgi:adhesin transport system outer membrane protein